MSAQSFQIQILIIMDNVFKIGPIKEMVCLNRPFFEGCLLQILLSPFLNALSQVTKKLFMRM